MEDVYVEKIIKGSHVLNYHHKDFQVVQISSYQPRTIIAWKGHIKIRLDIAHYAK